MAEKTPFKVGALKDPLFPFMRHDDTRADFDPWQFMKAMEAVPKDAGIEAAADAVRSFLNYPTQADVDASGQDGTPKIVTISLNDCNELSALVGEFISELPGTKKKLGMSQSLSPLASNRPS